MPMKKLRNPARHIRSLENWSRSFDGFFPTPDMAYKGQWHEKIPVFQKVVSPPRTNPNLQKQCTQILIDAAIKLRSARPRELVDAKIYAFLTFPDMFYSMIEVAFEPNPHLFFNTEKHLERRGNDSYWSEYFDVISDRIGGMELRVPGGFNVLGAGLRVYDANWMSEPEETEEWVIGEVKQS